MRVEKIVKVHITLFLVASDVEPLNLERNVKTSDIALLFYTLFSFIFFCHLHRKRLYF